MTPTKVLGFISMLLLAACSAQQTAPVIPAGKAQVSKPYYEKPAAPNVSKKPSTLFPSAQALLSESRQALARNDYGTAAAKAERAIRISPRAPEVYIAMAEVRLKQNKYGQAEQMLMKGLSMASGNERIKREIWSKVARVRDLAGDSTGAKSARDKADKFSRW